MKTHLLFLGLLSLFIVTGCQSPHVIQFDPSQGNPAIGMGVPGHISSQEMRQVAHEATQYIMSNAVFQDFLSQYKVAYENPNVKPVLKLDRTVNSTDDPNLNADEMTDILCEALLNSGIVRITLAEGAGRTDAIRNSRDLANDAAFNQQTVAQNGTLVAAKLILRPKIISNTVREGNTKVITRTFVLDIAYIDTGDLVCRFTRQFGFIRQRGAVGW